MMDTASYTAEYRQRQNTKVNGAEVPPELAQLRDLAARMVSLQAHKDALEDQLKAINIELDRLRTKDIPDAMAETDTRTVTFSGIGRVQLAADVYVSYSDKKEQAFGWLTNNGYSNCIQETVNASVVKAIFRKMIKEGQPLPDNIFKITPFTRASIVKA